MTDALVAVVFGGASGIGAAIVTALRDTGYDVHVADLAGAPPVDVTDEDAVQIFLEDVVERGGSVVSIASLHARQPGTGMAAYCSATAGLAMLTEVAALELAGRGVRVNAVSPGLVPTPLTAPALDIPGIEDDYLENTPLGRAGRPEEVADAVLFLARNGWVTGEVLDVNGGAHLKRYPDIHGHVVRAFG